MTYTVKNVSEIAGISIRTLHHYDHIGLFKPDKLTESGYRIYSDSDLERLQEILFFRELDFNLKEIKNILDSPDYDRKVALLSHKELLTEKKRRIEELIISVDKTINNIKGEINMSKKEMFKAFDDTQMEEYKKEAKERWPNKYAESEKKMANYTKADYERIKRDQSEAIHKAASLIDKEPNDPEVQKLMSDNFNYINNNFYSCTPEMFKGLGQMYVDDERFKATYENAKSGLSVFMRDAMKIFSDNYSK